MELRHGEARSLPLHAVLANNIGTVLALWPHRLAGKRVTRAPCLYSLAAPPWQQRDIASRGGHAVREAA